MSESGNYFTERKVTAFSPSRVLSVTRRVLRQITRDRRTFAMIIVMPLIIMFIFGVALSGEIKNSPVVIDNQDLGITAPFEENFASLIVAELQQDDRMEVTLGDFDQGIGEVESSDKKAAIRFPANFSESMLNASMDPDQVIMIEIYIDATRPQIQGSIMGAIQEAIKEGLEEYQASQGITIEETFAYDGAEYTGLETGTPAVMGFVLTFLALLLSLLILIRERVEGTQYRLLATPLTSRERLLGYIIALTIFALMMALSLLVISVVLFNVPVQGSMILLLGTLVLFALVNVTMAVLLSNFAENELQAMQMAPMTALPSMALSGMLVPVETLPAFIQPLSAIIPLTYAIQVFEGIMLKGYGIVDLLFELGVLTGIAVLFTVISLITVKGKQE